VPAFDGQTWARIGNRIWATLSYLPGRALASEQNPDMEAAGAFLARYHRAARSVPMPGQRPTSAPLPRLRAVTPPDPLRRSLRSAGAQGRFARLLDDLEAGLRAIQYESLEHIPIHGDATNDNLIVEGDPPTIVGMIDFGSASLAPWLTDLAAALWRSGRAIDTDVGYDLDRVTRYVAGYHRESPIPKRLAQAIPLLIQGRGLQLISRRVRRLESRHVAADPPRLGLTLARACWAHDHRQDLLAAIATALHTS
jgi:Ser/Thr protein kinase RdoA (MazF antagonist)